MTVTTRVDWVMWRRLWWDHPDTPARLRKDIFALTRYSSPGTLAEWTSSTSLNMICTSDRILVTRDTGWFLLSSSSCSDCQYKYCCSSHHICRLWFNFSVENVHQDQRIIFNIVNLSKSKNLFRVGLTPIVRSSSRPRWSAEILFYDVMTLLNIKY